MKVKNVCRQPLCLQGQSGGIHLMPGEVRTVEEGDLAPRQTQALVKQGLLQVIAIPAEGSGFRVAGSGKNQKANTTNPKPGTQNPQPSFLPEPGTQNPELANRREATHG